MEKINKNNELKEDMRSSIICRYCERHEKRKCETDL